MSTAAKRTGEYFHYIKNLFLTCSKAIGSPSYEQAQQIIYHQYNFFLYFNGQLDKKFLLAALKRRNNVLSVTDKRGSQPLDGTFMEIKINNYGGQNS